MVAFSMHWTDQNVAEGRLTRWVLQRGMTAAENDDPHQRERRAVEERVSIKNMHPELKEQSVT